MPPTDLSFISHPSCADAPTLPHSLLRGVRGHPNPSQGWDHHEEGALSAAQLETVVYAGQVRALVGRFRSDQNTAALTQWSDQNTAALTQWRSALLRLSGCSHK